MAKQRRIVIVGASLAGAKAAESLRELGFDGQIRLIGDEVHPPYERPPLSKAVLLGNVEPQSTYLSPITDWSALGVELICGTRIVQANPGDGGVIAADGRTFCADQILLATGGVNRPLGVPGEQLSGVRSLRTIEDAIILRDSLVSGSKIVIIGGGFIGFEVAAVAAGRGADVVVLEQASVPLARVLGPRWGQYLAALHSERGIRVETGVEVSELSGEEVVRQVVLADGRRFEADVVIIGVGIVPATGLAERAGARIQGGVVVDAHARTSVPGMFAAGDVAVQRGWRLDSYERMESWQNAREQGAVAAAAMLGLQIPARSTPWFWSDQGDLKVQVAGRLTGLDSTIVRGDIAGGKLVAFHLRDGLVVGAFALNNGRDLRGAMALIDSEMEPDPNALADPSVDLRTLGRTRV